MSTDRRQFRYRGPENHAAHEEPFCAGCETFAVLRQVEGFHEEVADITSDIDARDDSGGVPASDRVVAAVEGAALRGFLMGIDLATRWAIDENLRKEIEEQAHGFLS